jgi:hypothetical protein
VIENSDAKCSRAGIEMTKAQWFSVPKEVRDRYRKETGWGEGDASPETIEAICRAISRMDV